MHGTTQGKVQHGQCSAATAIGVRLSHHLRLSVKLSPLPSMRAATIGDLALEKEIARKKLLPPGCTTMRIPPAHRHSAAHRLVGRLVGARERELAPAGPGRAERAAAQRAGAGGRTGDQVATVDELPLCREVGDLHWVEAADVTAEGQEQQALLSHCVCVFGGVVGWEGHASGGGSIGAACRSAYLKAMGLRRSPPSVQSPARGSRGRSAARPAPPGGRTACGARQPEQHAEGAALHRRGASYNVGGSPQSSTSMSVWALSALPLQRSASVHLTLMHLRSSAEAWF